MDVWIEKRHCIGCDHLQDVYGIKDSYTVLFKCEKCNAVTFLQDSIDLVFNGRENNMDTT